MLPWKSAFTWGSDAVRAFSALGWRAVVAGSVRRCVGTVNDVDLVLVPNRRYAYCEEALIELRHLSDTAEWAHCGPQLGRAVVTWGIFRFGVDVYFARAENFGIVLQNRTGDADFNISLALRAKSMGLHYHPTRGIMRDDKVIASTSEEEVFQALNLDMPDPADRRIDWQGLLEAAE